MGMISVYDKIVNENPKKRKEIFIRQVRELKSYSGELTQTKRYIIHTYFTHTKRNG